MNMLLWIRLFAFSLFSLCVVAAPQFLHAAEFYDEYQETLRGELVEVVLEEMREMPGMETSQLVQTLRVEILDGERAGEILQFENDFQALEKGDTFYFNHFVYIDGSEYYTVLNIDRHSSLYVLLGFFVLVILLFGGWQGARSLLALIGSFFAIFYILIPGLLHGWDPLLASMLVAGAILFVAIFFTHGFNRESLVAYGGTIIAVCITGLLALYAVHATSLTGFASDESVYLNFNTGGSLDFIGLLLGAIIIGVLGVLDDIAITQAAVVTELYNSNNSLTRREAYRRALRVGKEHVGALVNTLVLAYAGASLPLLLYVYLLPTGFSETINLEIFATEIVRTVVGSIGLVLTVPIVTALATHFLKDYKPRYAHAHSHQD